jgi:uncharacterized protein YecE (DUF72 family)
VRERYDHLYSLHELDPWVTRAKQVAEDTTDTYVVTNNHNIGKAVVNALEISSILKGRPIPVPPALLSSYPELQEFSRAEKS